ncbi:MAG: glycoside hydrolase family 20 zincin-like fold domain-containing protein [Vulcanimicrobiaceae bacterium]
MRPFAFLGLVLVSFAPQVARAGDNSLHLLPKPSSIHRAACARPFSFARPLRVGPDFDEAAIEQIDERWPALGLPAVVRSVHPDVTIERAALASQAYRLRVGSDGAVRIAAGDGNGVFYAAMTLAQLPQHRGGGWTLPCVEIADAPALKWRVLSDDVSRGPLPTMRYFEERIRTIAAFKMNGYSPYMEHTLVDPNDPLPAPLDGITPAQLSALNAYATRFHVTLIPEQQTFAHMHNTLAVERYASAGELQHDFLLSPAASLSYDYIKHVIDDELAVIPHPPFFHIGSDETSELGDGQSKSLVAQAGKAHVYAEHINRINAFIEPSGARVMLWDDGIESDPSIMPLLPKNAVIVNWHYGNEKSFEAYIKRIASGGFDQMVAPGANNWNQIYPDIDRALANENTFITEGKAARVLGLFQTVWHDDGETLYEATWYPLLYAASSAWESGSIDPGRYQQDFPVAFFGTGDARYGSDIAKLADAQSRITSNPYDTSNYLFWSDAFDPHIAARMEKIDLRAVRLEAEDVEQHLLRSTPPLHQGAARVMYLAARRYDLLGRKFQISAEIRNYYADAKAQIGEPQSRTIRDLYWCKYWFWELRDAYEAIAPLYAAAWRYESRAGHLASNMERYRMASEQAIERADRVNTMTYEDYVRRKSFPTLDEVLGLAHD